MTRGTCDLPYNIEGKWYDTCLRAGPGLYCPPQAQSEGQSSKMWARCHSSCGGKSPASPICRSSAGQPCMLHFNYDEMTYNRCVKDLDADPGAWCPTATDIEGNPMVWEECMPDCPTVHLKTSLCLMADSGRPCPLPFRYNDTGWGHVPFTT